MRRRHWRKGALAAMAMVGLVLGACSDDDNGDTTPDAQVQDDAAPQVDAGVDAQTWDDAAVPDAEVPVCEPATRNFWMYDLSVMPPQYVEVPSTCRAAGPHTLIYVSDEIWEAPVTQPKVDALLRAFEESAASDPNRGIYELTTSTYGEPSDVDGNGKVFLFVTRIPSYGNYDFDGYMRREDVLGGDHSNQCEMVYVDGVRNELDSEYLLGVISHEFFHLLHLNQDPDEVSWLDETLAESSMVLCGYYGDLDTWVQDYAGNTNVTLTRDNPQFHYGAGFLFGAYLLERFGPTFLTELTQNPDNGLPSIEETLASLNEPVDFPTLFVEWGVANFLDEPSLDDGRYGYEAFDVPGITSGIVVRPGGQASAQTIHATAVVYYIMNLSNVPADSTVEITVDSPAYADLKVRVVSMQSAQPSTAQVAEATLDAQESVITVQNVGGDMNRVILVVANPTQADATITSVGLTVQ